MGLYERISALVLGSVKMILTDCTSWFIVNWYEQDILKKVDIIGKSKKKIFSIQLLFRNDIESLVNIKYSIISQKKGEFVYKIVKKLLVSTERFSACSRKLCQKIPSDFLSSHGT